MRRAALLVIALLLAGCTGGGGSDSDTDDDGVDDVVEREGRVIEVTLVNGTERRTVTSDVGTYDTDGDGLADGEESNARGTDPRDVDTDDDGLLDGKDSRAPDDDVAARWRASGILEVDGTFLGEFDACPAGGAQLRPNVASSDLPLPDELLDGEELRGWDVRVRGTTRHVTSDPCMPDTDRDGLRDHDEKLLASDPRDEDTDKDGTRDGIDADPVADLAIELADLVVELAPGSNATSVRVLIYLGQHAGELRTPGNATAVLPVDDATADRTSLVASLVIFAEDTRTGDPGALTDDPRGAILTFDLLRRTVEGAEADGDMLRFAGDDGSMSLRWSTVRR